MTKMEGQQERACFEETWKGIYRRHPNNIQEMWNEQEKVSYGNILLRDVEAEEEGGQNKFVTELWEHMDMAYRVRRNIIPMNFKPFQREETIEVTKKMKKGKAPGIDGIKSDMIKVLAKSEVCMENLTECMNMILSSGEVPKEWKISRTRMIRKNIRPMAEDFRPIALTGSTYKIFMSLVKERLESHLRENDIQNELQSGFTNRRRGEDNMFMLRYCVEETFRGRRKLVVTSIDFQKAFDSVNRGKMIETLKKYRVDPKLIEVIARIYSGDNTEVHVREDLRMNIEVSSGVRQGCSGSAVLFKLVVNMIINEVNEERGGFRNEKFRITSLFFADDGLILSGGIQEAKEMIKKVKDISSEYGLEVSQKKSKILIFNEKEKPERLENLKVVKEIKYLGVKVTDKRKLYDEHKKEIIRRMQRMMNMTNCVIEKSVNRVMIGKTYWKSVVLPSVLYASAVIDFRKGEVEKMQRMENSVMRRILRARSYAPICALRGEIGASLMSARIMKERLNYEDSLYDGRNALLKEIYIEMSERRTGWKVTTAEYRREIGLSDRYERVGREKISERVRSWDSDKWRGELENRSSLEIYKMSKRGFGDDEVYDNRKESKLWCEARMNTIRLEDRNRFRGEDIKCKLCGHEREDLSHFLLDCETLGRERAKIKQLQRPHQEDGREIVGSFLFDPRQVEEKKTALWQLYAVREEELRRLEE